ncbi:MAG: hypothetical protein C0468_03745, partial [Planctomyces sp.]|nr:hypothetical protein [Planctomyces sp.]
ATPEPCAAHELRPRVLGRALAWACRCYRSKIVNINVNILVASSAAVLLSTIPVHYSRYLGVPDESKLLIIAIALVADIVLDVSIYYALHWLANHWPRTWKTAGRLVVKAAQVSSYEPPPTPFLREATRVQVQRLALSPILYGTYLGATYAFLHGGMDRTHASLASWALCVPLTRVLHTLWMLRDMRRDARRWDQQILAEEDRIRRTLPTMGAP